MFVILSKRDSRQKENLENQMAIGAFVQNLMLLMHDEEWAHVGKHLHLSLIHHLEKQSALMMMKMYVDFIFN